MKTRQRFFLYVVAYLAYFVLLAAVLTLLDGRLAQAGPPWAAALGLAVLVVWPVPVLLHLFDQVPAWQKKLRWSGTLAPAQILSVRDSGIVTGFNHYVDLRLRVIPSGEPPFEADLEALASRTSMPVPGEVIMVRFDPANRRRVALAADAHSASTASSAMTDLSALVHAMSSGRIGALVGQLRELEARHRAGALSDQEFQVARKTLLA